MNLYTEESDKKIWLWLVAAAVLLNVPCLFNGVMEPDAALYASIAKQIALSNNWSHLYVNGQDWLDKPHLPFWAAAVSFKIFGINAFAYKFPSFLCFITGLHYTYQLAKLLFNNKITAALSAIFYAAALHTILANFDVRAEGYLTAFVSASTYYLLRIQQQKGWKNILPAAFFLALAVMTKGIFIIIIIFSGFILYWLLNKQWKQFINPAWYAVVLVTLLFITPELYSLWLQFDSQPAKVVFGETNVSGIKFFFWDSQFGRFFNTGPIKGAGDKAFFLHTSLWAYLPWSPLLVGAVIFLIAKRRVNNIPKELTVITGSALFGFLLFSFSKFQLPHYIVTLFPYFSIMTAAYIMSITSEKVWARWNTGMLVLFLISIALICLITFISRMPSFIEVSILLAVTTGIFIYYRKYTTVKGIVIRGICTAAILSVFLNFLFYPKLLQYQSGMVTAKWLHQNNNTMPVTMYRCNAYTFSFYNTTAVSNTDKITEIFKSGDTALIYTAAGELETLRNTGIKTKTLFTTGEFHITTLTPEFINYKTRDAAIGQFVIAQCINTK